MNPKEYGETPTPIVQEETNQPQEPPAPSPENLTPIERHLREENRRLQGISDEARQALDLISQALKDSHLPRFAPPMSIALATTKEMEDLRRALTEIETLLGASPEEAAHSRPDETTHHVKMHLLNARQREEVIYITLDRAIGGGLHPVNPVTLAKDAASLIDGLRKIQETRSTQLASLAGEVLTRAYQVGAIDDPLKFHPDHPQGNRIFHAVEAMADKLQTQDPPGGLEVLQTGPMKEAGLEKGDTTMIIAHQDGSNLINALIPMIEKRFPHMTTTPRQVVQAVARLFMELQGSLIYQKGELARILSLTEAQAAAMTTTEILSAAEKMAEKARTAAKEEQEAQALITSRRPEIPPGPLPQRLTALFDSVQGLADSLMDKLNAPTSLSPALAATALATLRDAGMGTPSPDNSLFDMIHEAAAQLRTARARLDEVTAILERAGLPKSGPLPMLRQLLEMINEFSDIIAPGPLPAADILKGLKGLLVTMDGARLHLLSEIGKALGMAPEEAAATKVSDLLARLRGRIRPAEDEEESGALTALTRIDEALGGAPEETAARTPREIVQRVQDHLAAHAQTIQERERHLTHYQIATANWLGKQRREGRPCAGCGGCTPKTWHGNLCGGAAWIAPPPIIKEVTGHLPIDLAALQARLTSGLLLEGRFHGFLTRQRAALHLARHAIAPAPEGVGSAHDLLSRALQEIDHQLAPPEPAPPFELLGAIQRVLSTSNVWFALPPHAQRALHALASLASPLHWPGAAWAAAAPEDGEDPWRAPLRLLSGALGRAIPDGDPQATFQEMCKHVAAQLKTGSWAAAHQLLEETLGWTPIPRGPNTDHEQLFRYLANLINHRLTRGPEPDGDPPTTPRRRLTIPEECGACAGCPDCLEETPPDSVTLLELPMVHLTTPAMQGSLTIRREGGAVHGFLRPPQGSAIPFDVDGWQGQVRAGRLLVVIQDPDGAVMTFREGPLPAGDSAPAWHHLDVRPVRVVSAPPGAPLAAGMSGRLIIIEHGPAFRAILHGEGGGVDGMETSRWQALQDEGRLRITLETPAGAVILEGPSAAPAPKGDREWPVVLDPAHTHEPAPMEGKLVIEQVGTGLWWTFTPTTGEPSNGPALSAEFVEPGAPHFVILNRDAPPRRFYLGGLPTSGLDDAVRLDSLIMDEPHGGGEVGVVLSDVQDRNVTLVRGGDHVRALRRAARDQVKVALWTAPARPAADPPDNFVFLPAATLVRRVPSPDNNGPSGDDSRPSENGPPAENAPAPDPDRPGPIGDLDWDALAWAAAAEAVPRGTRLRVIGNDPDGGSSSTAPTRAPEGTWVCVKMYDGEGPTWKLVTVPAATLVRLRPFCLACGSGSCATLGRGGLCLSSEVKNGLASDGKRPTENEAAAQNERPWRCWAEPAPSPWSGPPIFMQPGWEETMPLFTKKDPPAHGGPPMVGFVWAPTIPKGMLPALESGALSRYAGRSINPAYYGEMTISAAGPRLEFSPACGECAVHELAGEDQVTRHIPLTGATWEAGPCGLTAPVELGGLLHDEVAWAAADLHPLLRRGQWLRVIGETPTGAVRVAVVDPAGEDASIILPRHSLVRRPRSWRP